MALNCTMTKAMANTIPVSANMPEATAEKNAWAEATETPRVYDAKYACSSRGSTNPQMRLAAAYSIGISQRRI